MFFTSINEIPIIINFRKFTLQSINIFGSFCFG